MRLSQFIRDNREEIDQAINGALNFVPRTASCNCYRSGTDHYHEPETRLNDSERRQWILNDEGLYRWARSAGCRI